MDGEGEGLNPDSHVLPKLKQRGSRVDGGVDRISQLPNEILFLILSSLPVRNAAATTVLSSRWLDLWKQNPNLKFNLHSDRISQLPDQIILAILSLLTVRESVATSVLSSRWSDLWMLCPYLNFYGGDFDNGVNLCEVVNSVIQSHKAPSLKQFSVSFSVLESDKSAVTKWLEFVSSRPVEVLELDFGSIHYSVMVVLEESLREMSSPFLCGQSLKRLHLKSLKVSGEDIELFLRNCPLLEELMIQMAPLTSDINICGAKLMLKHLDLRGSCGAISLRVSAPNFTLFRFPETVRKLVLEHVPKLVEADLMALSSEFPVQYITHISQLQILKLNFYYPKLLSTDMFSHMPNLKKLFISWPRVSYCSLFRLTDLIWASPRLEEFTFRVILDAVGDPSAMLEDIINVERSPHQHLKVLNFIMYSYETDLLVELATYFSDNCVALRIIDISHLDDVDRDGIRQRLRGKLRSQIQMRFHELILKFLIVSGEDIELFLCNCPLLEELTIYKAPLTSDINVCGAKLMLKRLDLLGCEGAISLQVSAPNLTSFRFPHTVGKLVFENVPELVEADLVCLSPEFPVLHITCISQLQILKLNFSHFKLLYTDVLSHMPNLKKLFIHCVTVNNCSLPRLTDLIWVSPRLEEFTFQVLDTVGDPSAMVEDITNVERSPHQHLNVFNFEMFSDLTDLLVELATYFSDNCAAIRRIDIGHLDEERPDRDYISQRLRGKLRSQIQMRFYVLM